MIDDVAEGAETFSVRLSNPQSTDTTRVELGTKTGTATIEPSDALTAEVDNQDTTVLEGNSATFVVDLGGTSSASVEIDYMVAGSGDSAADAADFSPEKGKLTIPAGRSTGTIQVEAVDDDILEPDETLEVTLTGAAPANVVTVDQNEDSATTIIGASDSPARVSVADVTVDEGETAMIEVRLSKIVSSAVTVGYTLANVAPTSGADYSHTQADLVFMPGDTAKTIEVRTTPDSLAEDEETFTVTLEPPDPEVTGVSLGRSEATVTITDDALRATIKGPASVNEGDEAEYTVTVTGGTFGTGEDDQVTVSWSTEENGATSADFSSPTSGMLTITPEEPSMTFTIRTANDDEAELDEEFVVSLTATIAGDPVRTGSPARTTIVDNDGSVQVSIKTETDPDRLIVAEGQLATFVVELGTVVDEDVTVVYTTGAEGDSDTATADTDYVAAVGDTVVIPAGEMSMTISVATLRDNEEELEDEIFSVNLLDEGLREGVQIGTRTARATITDHQIDVSVTADQESVNEGSAAVFTVSLTVDDNPAGARNRSGVEVDYAVVGDVNAQDYREAGTGTLTIEADESEAMITITTIADGVLDPVETLTLSLTSATSLNDQGLAVVDDPPAGEATTTVVDEGTVTWSVTDASVEEGDVATFTISLNAPVQDDVTLTYRTVPGTATAGSDYTGVSNGTVTVTGNNTEETFTVATVDDSTGEATETFTVQLSLSSAPAGVGPQSRTATVTITDDDIRLRPVSPVTITEGETETVTLTLEQPLLASVKVRYVPVPSSTTADANDLSIALPLPPDAQGAYDLPIGFQGGPVTVRAVDDSLAEGTEQMVLELLTVPASGQPAKLGTIQITIEDNDELSASVTVPNAVAEGEVAPFTVKLSGGTSTAPVVVTYEWSGTAKAPGDYTAPSGSLTIPSGQSSGTIAIQTNTDNVIEPDETLVVTLTGRPTTDKGTARVGSPKSATTAIQDEVFHSFNRVNRTLLPSVVRASAAGALEAVSWRMAEASQGDSAGGYRRPRRADRALSGAAGERAGAAGRQLRLGKGAGRLLLPGAAEFP